MPGLPEHISYTKMPDLFADEWLSKCEGAEVQCLVYLVRRSFGYDERFATLTLTQWCTGVDGQDHGTGCSENTVRAALKRLEAKKMIQIRPHKQAIKGHDYTLLLPRKRVANIATGGVPGVSIIATADIATADAEKGHILDGTVAIFATVGKNDAGVSNIDTPGVSNIATARGVGGLSYLILQSSEDKEGEEKKKEINKERKSAATITKPGGFDETSFADFYNGYGHKKSRAAAKRAYAGARRKTAHETIMAGVRRYHESDEWHHGFRKHPATFLNGECWEDDYTQIPKIERNGYHASGSANGHRDVITVPYVHDVQD